MSLLHAQETPRDTRVAIDEAHHTVTIYLDGVPALHVNKDGLHVVQNINYGGALTDTGTAHLQSIIAEDSHAQ